MKAVILEKGEPYYTILSDVFHGIGQAQSNYNWLITDWDGVPRQIEADSKMHGRRKYCWMMGEELTAVAGTNREQWVWAVLSGFHKSVPLSDILRYELPYADGNPDFWNNPAGIQHPLAEIEIVAWDSSCTLFMSKNEELAEAFMEAFPMSEDLERYNLQGDMDQSEALEEWLRKNM